MRVSATCPQRASPLLVGEALVVAALPRHISTVPAAPQLSEYEPHPTATVLRPAASRQRAVSCSLHTTPRTRVVHETYLHHRMERLQRAGRSAMSAASPQLAG